MNKKDKLKKQLYKPTGVEWEYVNLRNISLLQISIWARGLNNPGFYPPLRFHFGNYIGVGEPNKGNHGIFDKNLMNRVLKSMQKDIDCTDSFASKLHKRAELIYSMITKASGKLCGNLRKMSDKGIAELYQGFKEAMIFSPVILMPMYAVDGCLDENYHLVRYLKEKINPEEIGRAIAVLSATTYKTVAFMERESVLKISLEIKRKKIRAIHLLKKDDLYKKIKKHILDYQWMHSEYLSKTWNEDKYFKEMIKLSKGDPEAEIREMHKRLEKTLNARKNLIKKIGLSPKAKKVLDALNEFAWEVDYSKGVFSEAFLYFRNLLAEIARRNNLKMKDLYSYSIDEFNLLVKDQIAVSRREIEERKKFGYVMLFFSGKLRIFSGKQKKEIMEKEKINQFFQKNYKNVTIIRGLAGNIGKTSGRVRIIRDKKDMNAFQKGEIVVTYMTTLEFTPLFYKAAGIITDEGGLGCHAAIVAREFDIPCIVGTKIATKALKNGDLVELDANKGMARLLKNK